MLNLVNLIKKNLLVRTAEKKGDSIHAYKRDIPANKEWFNSVYAFNKNSTRLLPAIHNYVFRLITSYFNMTIKKMEVKIKGRRGRKARSSSGSKIWVSTPEIKHLSEKVNITIYVYNKLYNIYKRKLSFAEFKWGPKLVRRSKRKIQSKITIFSKNRISVKPINKKTISKMKSRYTDITQNKILSNNNTSRRYYSVNNKIKQETNKKNIHLTKKIMVLKSQCKTYLGKKYLITGNSHRFYVEMIKWLKLDKFMKIKEYMLSINNLLSVDKEFLEHLKYLKIERYSFLINQFKKELIYLKLRQKILFTEFKFTELYLTPLINLLQTIYKKKIEFNIVILKNYYLSSSIMSQIIVTKARKPIYRGKALKVVDRAMSSIKIPILSNNKLERIERKYITMQNVLLDGFLAKSRKQDYLDQFLLTGKLESNKNIHNLVLKNIENKAIAGIFFKISGRLTKRYKAQRAVSSLRARGTLQNVHSAHKGLPSVLSRGFSNINVEKTMTHSKTRVGAYGLTGWVSSY